MRLSSTRTRTLGRLAALAAVVLFLASPASAHLELLRTVPAADAAVATAPSEIRLWFSEAPQVRGASVRLADAAGKLVPATTVAADAGDAKQLFIRLAAVLASGSYTVHWRVLASDDHVMNGTFTFQVR